MLIDWDASVELGEKFPSAGSRNPLLYRHEAGWTAAQLEFRQLGLEMLWVITKQADHHMTHAKFTELFEKPCLLPHGNDLGKKEAIQKVVNVTVYEAREKTHTVDKPWPPVPISDAAKNAIISLIINGRKPFFCHACST